MPDAGLYGLLGSLFFVNGEYLNAGIALKKADVLAPLPPEQRFTLAMCYVLLKTPAKARAELERLASEFPRDSKYIYWLGRLDYDAQHFSAALSWFHAAVKIDSGNVRAHDNIGLSYEALGQNEEAIRSYTTAVKLNKTAAVCSPWPPHNLASLLRKLSRFEEAWGNAQEALRCDPDFARGHHILGLLLERGNRLDEAIASLRRAVESEPSYADAHYVLARLLQRSGKTAEAALQFKAFEKLKAAQQRK
ncbi:MAG: tetratricopeptide repeat protein [Bryobacteraceae bacterium]|nr:tetratricopeptide repeat protein [Bryobacteraceae bacterium]